MDNSENFKPSAETTGQTPESEEELALKRATEYVSGVLGGLPADHPQVLELAKKIAGLELEVKTYRGHLTSAVETGVATETNLTEHLTAAVELGEMYREKATFDGLTGLLRHEEFTERLNQMIEDADRTDSDLVLLLIDGDKFKTVNDTYGHPAGNILLETIGATIRLSGGDLLARDGGEEFKIAMKLDPKNLTPEMQALPREKRIEQFIEDKYNQLKENYTEMQKAVRGEPHREDLDPNIIPISRYAPDRKPPIQTFSMGAAYRIPGSQGNTLDEINGRVDSALYVSKDAGRNRLTIAKPSSKAA